MRIESLPKEYIIDGHKCGLSVTHDTPGWLVTYTYFGKDLLNMDFHEDLQDSIDSLCKKLSIIPEPITEEWLEENGYHHEKLLKKFDRWISEDRRIEFTKDSNMIGRDWYVHVDNEDLQTIGGMSVQYTWQLKSLLNLLRK